MFLRVLTIAVYASIAMVAIAAIAPQTRLAGTVLLQRFSYAPDLTLPWLWLGLTGVVAGTIASAVRRMAAGRRVGIGRYTAVLLAGAMAMAVRRYVPIPSRPTVADGIAHLVARVEMACDEAYAADKQYTDNVARLTTAWPSELKTLGFYRRGAIALKARLRVVPDSWGPILAAPADTQPGDLVLSLSRDRRSYWISAFTLDRAGRIAPLSDERGRAIVASASQGHAASRLDPLFPEYPHRNEAHPVGP